MVNWRPGTRLSIKKAHALFFERPLSEDEEENIDAHEEEKNNENERSEEDLKKAEEPAMKKSQ